MAANILNSKQAKYGAYAGAYILVIIAVLAAVNFLANRYSKTYDSTSNKQFSLSDQTIKIASGLKNDVKVTVIATGFRDSHAQRKEQGASAVQAAVASARTAQVPHLAGTRSNGTMAAPIPRTAPPPARETPNLASVTEAVRGTVEPDDLDVPAFIRKRAEMS